MYNRDPGNIRFDPLWIFALHVFQKLCVSQTNAWQKGTTFTDYKAPRPTV